jgi:Protein of unknown function (DUF541)
MRIVLAAILTVTVGLVAASLLGVAAAEAPTTTTPIRTVSVEGVASVPIPQDASLEAADAAYRQAMAAAMSDGQGKAEFLAGKAGVTLAAVQSIGEGGGSIECRTKGGEGENEGNTYTRYMGEEPDVGSVTRGISYSVAPEAAARPSVKIKKPKPKHPTAKRAVAGEVVCTLSAQITLVYAIS